MAVLLVAINKEEVLGLVKSRLGLDPAETAFDELILPYMDQIETKILNYINHAVMPDGLKYTWAAMTAAALQTEQQAILFPPSEEDMEMNETSFGDTTVKPIKPVSKPTIGPTLAVMDKMLFDYMGELIPFRRMRW